MLCLHCGKEVSLFKKLSDAQFCSAEHRQHFYDDQQRLMLERVQAAAARAQRLRGAATGGETSVAPPEQPVAPDGNAPVCDDSSFRLGLMLLEKGDFRRSVEAFESFISSHSDSPKGYLNLGTAHWRLKEHEQAVKAFERALALDADSLEALRGLAAVAIECEDFERALDLQAKLMQRGEKMPEPFASPAMRH